MDQKTTGLIATIASAVVCGLPGLLGVCIGAMVALISQIPGADIDVVGSSEPAAALGVGIVILCLGVIGVAIPIVVGVVFFRRKSAPAAPAGDKDEPLPPAI